MAVDGRKFSDTLRHGSEDWNDFQCSPCARDGKNVAAIKYCVECDKNLCSICLTHHNKFAILRGHRITDKLSSQTGQKRQDLLSQGCDEHEENSVDLYSRHDSVARSSCTGVNRSERGTQLKEAISVPKSKNHHGDFRVRVQSDKSKCRITGICFTTSGNLFIADTPNKRVKKLDDAYAVIKYLDMPDDPFGLCEVDETFLAVTLISHKKVQFVHQQTLSLMTSFPVGDRCRGKTCLHGQLYVCCGGNREFEEGLGRVEVFNMAGILLRIFYEGLIWPFSATGGKELFITERVKGNLIKVRMSGYLVSETQMKKMSELTGLCRIGDGQLFVAGWKSNNIVLISENGGHQQELLTWKDGVVKPWAIGFDEKQSRLIVSLFDTEVIKVFDVIH